MNPLEKIMMGDSPKIKAISDHLPEHEVQILYTRIERDENDNPSFQEFSFQLNENQYFYPASTAKMPVAILALQRINELRAEGININENSNFIISEPETNEVIINADSTAENGLASISHMIKKIFLVSDNDAYNYLFDFLGRDYINEQLRIRGMQPAHLNHKFLYGANNKHTWDFKFYDENEGLVYEQKSISSKVDKHNFPLIGMKKGIGFTDDKGNLFEEPFDFSEKNYFSLKSLNKILKGVIFPESLAKSEQFNLTEDQYQFLRFWMSRNTLESQYPNYDYENYYESYVKFLMFGDDQSPMPDNIRIYNKVGEAYGTLTDVAYIVDSKTGIEFMLAATIQVNKNEIFNDGIYEYDELGFPFMAELGKQVYQYELSELP